MKISELTIEELKGYANVFHTEDDTLFTTILLAVKSYMKAYTGLTDLQMDEKDDLTIAFMVLANEMYDNRAFTVDNTNANKVAKGIMDIHAVNLL